MQARYYIEESWGAICDGKQLEGERMMGDEQVVIELNRLESKLAEARADIEKQGDFHADQYRKLCLYMAYVKEENRTLRARNAKLEAESVLRLKQFA